MKRAPSSQSSVSPLSNLWQHKPAVVGFVFGHARARRAARLNPIDALRHK